MNGFDCAEKSFPELPSLCIRSTRGDRLGNLGREICPDQDKNPMAPEAAVPPKVVGINVSDPAPMLLQVHPHSDTEPRLPEVHGGLLISNWKKSVESYARNVFELQLGAKYEFHQPEANTSVGKLRRAPRGPSNEPSHELASPFERRNILMREREPLAVRSLRRESIVPIGFDAVRIVSCDHVDAVRLLG